jgi:hypothetical protein
LPSRLLFRNVKDKIYKSMILQVALYGCETFCHIKGGAKTEGVLEQGPKGNIWTKEGVTGEWRKLHNEELHILYSFQNIIRQIKSRRMRWAGHVARMGEERKVHTVVVGKPEGKRPLPRLRHRWENGIITDLREIGWGECRVDSVGSG